MNPAGFEEFVLTGDLPAMEFRPTATYDPDGDCIEFIACNENFYRKRLDSMVTAYYGMGNDEVVGAFIKGVREILREAQRRAPGFKIEVAGRKIELVWVFTACLWGPERDPDSLEVTIYKKLRRAAAINEIEFEADLQLA